MSRDKSKKVFSMENSEDKQEEIQEETKTEEQPEQKQEAPKEESPKEELKMEKPKKKAKSYIHIDMFLQTAKFKYNLNRVHMTGFKAYMFGKHYQHSSAEFEKHLKEYLGV